jgi:hypothetical protein
MGWLTQGSRSFVAPTLGSVTERRWRSGSPEKMFSMDAGSVAQIPPLVSTVTLTGYILRTRRLPQLVGWRHYPDSHGKRIPYDHHRH